MTGPDLLQPKRVLKITKRPHPQFLNNAFLDPYVGCEFACAYCYGVKEDRRVGVKTNCAFALKRELEEISEENPEPREGKVSIGISFATDPYQPAEEQYQLTLRALELAKEKQYPVQIITKSDLVFRDAKLLSELSNDGLCVVSVSLFTLNETAAKAFEPHVPPPAKRLEMIKKLREEGITCGAVLMPIFPHVTDSQEELEKTFAGLKDAGALYCVPGILSLAQKGVKERVMDVLSEHFPRACYQYSVLYDDAGKPSENYCKKIERLLKFCSEKYSIPSILPVLGAALNRTLIVEDSI